MNRKSGGFMSSSFKDVVGHRADHPIISSSASERRESLPRLSVLRGGRGAQEAAGRDLFAHDSAVPEAAGRRRCRAGNASPATRPRQGNQPDIIWVISHEKPGMPSGVEDIRDPGQSGTFSDQSHTAARIRSISCR